MELKEFVTESLVQIAEGISKAADVLNSGQSGAVINPRVSSDLATTNVNKARPVLFDVAITVIEQASNIDGSSIRAKGGILSVVSASAKSDKSVGDMARTEAISRIKFEVQMIQPGRTFRNNDGRIASTVNVV